MPLGMSKNSFFVNQTGKKLAFRQSNSFAFAEQGNEELYYALDSEDNVLRVHHFKSTSDTGLTFTTGGEIYVALVGGGGGGGHAGIGSAGNYSNSYVWAGGGGAGGVVETTYTVSSNSSISFQIGTGGTAGVTGYRGSKGGDTTFNGLTAFGGGGGGGGRPGSLVGGNGGAGGGGAFEGCCVINNWDTSGAGSGTSGQGYPGGSALTNTGFGGGGGGAGGTGYNHNEAVTSNRGRGGIGKLVFERYLGGGGGAGEEGGSVGQDGGAGGGGRGAASRTPGGNATSGVNGYGGGGGGGSFYNSGNGFVPGNGGNGGVLVAYEYGGDPDYPDWESLGNNSKWYGIGARYDITVGYSWEGSSTLRANTPGDTSNLIYHISPGVYHNGNYYAPPSRTGTNIVKYNISSNTFSTISIPSYGGGNYGFWSAVLGQNGKIYFIPWDAANVVVLDTSNDSISTISGSPGGSIAKWGGGVLANNGVIYTLPGNRNSVARITTTNNTFAETFISSSSGGSGEAWYRGGVLSPDGNFIYFFPRTSANIGKYNINSNTLSTFGSSMFSGCSLGAWESKIGCAFLAPNQKIYAFGGSSTNANCPRIVKLDPADDSLTEISSDYAFGRGCIAPDGKVYFLGSSYFLVFDTETETLSLETYTTNPTVGLFPFVAEDGSIYGIPGIGGSPVLRLNQSAKSTISISENFVQSRYNKSSL